MIKFIYSILIYSIIACCDRSSKKDVNKNELTDSIRADISFSKRVVDLGSISNDTTLQVPFWVKNTGKVNLIIDEVSPECGCIGYKLENDTILPGNSAKLLINFNTKGKASGLQSQAIIIKSNAQREYNTIFIKCKVH